LGLHRLHPDHPIWILGGLEDRVLEQMALIERRTEQVRNAALAEEFLVNIEQTLEQSRVHEQPYAKPPL
jgi:hypothetical protein